MPPSNNLLCQTTTTTTTESFNDNHLMSVPLMIMSGSSFKLCKVSRYFFGRLLNLSKEISMSNLSFKQLRYVSMMTSFFLGLKEDLGLNLWAGNDLLFLKCHINRSFLPYSSISVFNFLKSLLLTVYFMIY